MQVTTFDKWFMFYVFGNKNKKGKLCQMGPLFVKFVFLNCLIFHILLAQPFLPPTQPHESCSSLLCFHHNDIFLLAFQSSRSTSMVKSYTPKCWMKSRGNRKILLWYLIQSAYLSSLAYCRATPFMICITKIIPYCVNFIIFHGKLLDEILLNWLYVTEMGYIDIFDFRRLSLKMN